MTDHVFEQLASSELISYAPCKGDRRRTNNKNLVTDFEFVFSHALEPS